MLKKITLSISVMMFFSVSVNAANSDGQFFVYSLGGNSCGKFIQAVDEGRNTKNWINLNSYQYYTRGYLTAINQYQDGTISITDNTDMAGVEAFIEKYCRENPLSDYISAVSVLVKTLSGDATE